MKTEKSKQTEMLLVDRTVQLNPHLTMYAKLVHVLLLNPEKCGKTTKEMAEYLNESEDSIEIGLKELEKDGLIKVN